MLLIDTPVFTQRRFLNTILLGVSLSDGPWWGGSFSWFLETARTQTHTRAAASLSPAHSSHREASPGDRRSPDCESGMCARLCAACCGSSTSVAQQFVVATYSRMWVCGLRCAAVPASRRNVFVFLGSILRHDGPSQAILKAFQMLCASLLCWSSVSMKISTCEELHAEPLSLRPQHPLFQEDKQRIILKTLFYMAF